jgi:hypothetical protein
MEKVAQATCMDTERSLGHFPLQIRLKARIRTLSPGIPLHAPLLGGVLPAVHVLCEPAIFRLNVRWLSLQAIVVEL